MLIGDTNTRCGVMHTKVVNDRVHNGVQYTCMHRAVAHITIYNPCISRMYTMLCYYLVLSCYSDVMLEIDR